jgi:hypothetical protein
VCAGEDAREGVAAVYGIHHPRGRRCPNASRPESCDLKATIDATSVLSFSLLFSINIVPHEQKTINRD